MRVIDLADNYKKTYMVCLEDWSEEMKEAGNHNKRSLFFGGILFGINWCIYTLFWPLLFDISLFETFLRISLDILYIIIGTYVVERFFSK